MADDDAQPATLAARVEGAAIEAVDAVNHALISGIPESALAYSGSLVELCRCLAILPDGVIIEDDEGEPDEPCRD